MSWPKGTKRSDETRARMRGARPKASASLKGNKNARSKGLAPEGQSKHPLFLVYYAMLNRCKNPESQAYSNYGARGIQVCERWLEKDGQGFVNFVGDMKERPQYTTKKGTVRYATLERQDNNGNYEPVNCVWATYEEQSRNQRVIQS